MTKSSLSNLRVWRSMLFVPAHVEKFSAKAHERGADACVLDLEDSVPAASKAQARAGLRNVAAGISAHGVDVLVRINSAVRDADADIQAAVSRTVCALLVPKVDSAATMQRIGALLDRIELTQGLPVGHTRLVALIEDVQALPVLDEIAASSPRLIGMTLGPEDFSVSAGCQPTTAALLAPSQMVLFACRRHGLLPFGFPGSIGEFSDLAALRSQIDLARECGFVGALCVHPAQVELLNQGFMPAAEELADAQALLQVCDAAMAQGRGAAEYRGKMIDPPVVARARELLRRASIYST
jgi:citrate lyase subunit beta / citryl-CoA lyase